MRLSHPGSQLWADPSDINILPEYSDDPRTVDNLIDGVNLTCDDLHAWLTPYTPGANHYIWLEFDEVTTLSMLRIWNYNKSRIHSYRGARYVEISLDDVMIFKGEIQRAPGRVSILDYESCCECILFTTNQAVLRLVEKYDTVFQSYLQAKQESKAEGKAIAAAEPTSNELLRVFLQEKALTNDPPPQQLFLKQDTRPATSASLRPSTLQSSMLGLSSFSSSSSPSSSGAIRPSTAALVRSQPPLLVRKLEIALLSNWGDPYLMGLTGLVALDDRMEEVELPLPDIFLAALQEDRLDYIEELIQLDGVERIIQQPRHTADPQNMFLISKPAVTSVVLVISFVFPRERFLKGLKVWNYNSSLNVEDTCIGVKNVLLFVNDSVVSESIVRKAPGQVKFDFSQFLTLSSGRERSQAAKSILKARSRPDLSLSSTFASLQQVAENSDQEDEGNAKPIEQLSSASNDDLLGIQSKPAVPVECTCSIPQQYETPVSFCG